MTFLTDGGEDIRDLPCYLNPQAEHLLDWFHITMRITVMTNMAKSLRSHHQTPTSPHPVIGFSPTTLPPSTAEQYRKAIAALDAAITAYRHAEVAGVSRPKASNYVKAECECPRTIRVGKTVLAQASILCGACGKEFCAEETGDDDQD